MTKLARGVEPARHYSRMNRKEWKRLNATPATAYTIFLSTLISEFIFVREYAWSVYNHEELLVQKRHHRGFFPFLRALHMKRKKHDLYFWKLISNVIIITRIIRSQKLFYHRLKINLNYCFNTGGFICMRTNEVESKWK